MLNDRPTPTALGSRSEPPLYMAELLHRLGNEYANAIALASVTASRTTSAEAKAALEPVKSGRLPSTTFNCFFFQRHGEQRYIHSFPTRRPVAQPPSPGSEG